MLMMIWNLLPTPSLNFYNVACLCDDCLIIITFLMLMVSIMSWCFRIVLSGVPYQVIIVVWISWFDYYSRIWLIWIMCFLMKIAFIIISTIWFDHWTSTNINNNINIIIIFIINLYMILRPVRVKMMISRGLGDWFGRFNDNTSIIDLLFEPSHLEPGTWSINDLIFGELSLGLCVHNKF